MNRGDLPTSLPLAVSMGEPAGCGVELALMAWSDRNRLDIPPFILVGDPDFIAWRAREAALDTDMEAIHSVPEASDLFRTRLPVHPLARARVRVGAAGTWNTQDAPAVIEAIEAAVTLVHDAKARAVVTAPIQKAPLLRTGFPHPGHTEFLGALAERWPNPGRAVMMLACDELRVVPVTGHIALADVPATLTTERIIETAHIVAGDLKQRFGIANPRLALTGLNPHAGENDTLGTEDEAIIRPAVDSLVADGLVVTGPHPADTLFHASARRTYDAAIAMYHDQALIPIKTIAFDEAVNVTLGLPFVRTSPDHGTALDIAGTGRANPASFIAALKLADRLSRPTTHA